MKLETVRIKRFRSIEDVTLENIGELNVLIGKNNSGKSNILFAVDSFFACIKGGNLVTSESPFGTEIDFFERRTQEPIEIEMSFSIQQSERDDLVKDIVQDAPQMANAAEAISPASLIVASVRTIRSQRRATFVSEITLRSSAKLNDKATRLLWVSTEAAAELLSKSIGSNRAIRQASSIEEMSRRLDADDWSRLREAAKEGQAISRMWLRREMDREAGEKVEAAIRQAETFSDFRRAIDSLVTATKQEADKTVGESLKNKIGTFAGEEATIPKYVQNLVKRLGGKKILYLRERRSPIGEDEAKRLLSLKVQRGGTDILRNIQDTVSALLGVRIDAFNSATPGKEAEMDVDNFLAEVNGSGVREALRLVLDFEFQKPDLFLVEEPEIYLHPALETSMMRYLKTISSSAQIFITTHSTNFLDTAEMKNVYLVSKPKSTQVQKLNFEEAELQIPHELGIRLSSLFLFDRLVFVEGPSDEAVLREWAAKLRINFSQMGVGFVHMGGVHNFGYFAAEQTMAFLMRRKVKLWFLLDRDEKEESEIAKLAKKCSPHASLNVLKKRELENYLAVPRVVAEFIELKRKLADATAASQTPSEQEVSKKIEEIAEKLKTFAIEKRVARTLCRPVYPITRRLFEGGEAVGAKRIGEEIAKGIAELQALKADVERIYGEQTTAIQAAWNQDKLSLVPGDLLLDGVCQSFGVRFRKEVDSSRAAALLNADEIDGEIKGILQEIGKA